LTESLAIEVKPFGIRILIVCPGSFRTEGKSETSTLEYFYADLVHVGMYSIPFFTENNIEDYDTTRKNAISAYQSIPGKEPGNPVKAMSALVDIVKGTGVAEGKSFPWILLLGQDAENDLRSRWARVRFSPLFLVCKQYSDSSFPYSTAKIWRYGVRLQGMWALTRSKGQNKITGVLKFRPRRAKTCIAY